uniref:NADH-ubiquinone oxidoreductase chain 1 n=1 Tax=Diaphanosoma excisum TaxID=2094052 RepID=A0A8A1RXM4_9CRUS|nr:NADH dehydrogenase subunit 1 [Diaphanosoma excisum]QST19908.1 NADH dehydrogenase subunit 1 [Diaphanosoma excisum]
MLTLVLLILNVICVLVGVAFFTLFERKLLGYIQLRKGPNKTGFMGLLQPFADAIKLFTKEHVGPSVSNYFPFIFAPIISFFLALFVWSCIPSYFNLMDFELGVLFFLVCLGLNVYGLLASGWSSNSKYALLGALRGVAQTISYEVSLALIILAPCFIVQSFDLSSFQLMGGIPLIFVFPFSAWIFFVSALAETNRTPFDFAEGESELVSGYNVEYASGGFALIMLAEYTSILFMSMLFSVLYLGAVPGSFLGVFSFTLVAFLFVWVRGTLPRFRYDKLMGLAWKSLLPLSLFYLVLVVSFLVSL